MASMSLSKVPVNTWMVAGAMAAAAVLGYAVYFDTKRRNDPVFRKQLQKQKRKLEKIRATQQKSARGGSDPTPEGALEYLEDEVFPSTPEEKEKYFMEQLSKGELLTKSGPEAYEAAAACFYKALKVYPSPDELIMIYQKTIPDAILNLVMGMLTTEVKKKQESYYNQFPPASMNVKVVEMLEGVSKDGKSIVKRTLAATKDISEGETIYVESPIVAALEPSLENTGNCSYCLKHITGEAVALQVKSDKTGFTYCCDTCEKEAWELYNHLLYPEGRTVDPSLSAARIHDLCKSHNAKTPMMIARFLSLMVHEDQKRTETLKEKPNSVKESDKYSVWDHIERMRYLELKVDSKGQAEAAILRKVLGKKVPGLDEFLSDERYLTLKGKLLYNMEGVAFTGHPIIEEQQHQALELQRSRFAHTVGAGLYPVTSYLPHSCAPNAEISFPSSNIKLSLIARNPIKSGERITVAFINLDLVAVEPSADAAQDNIAGTTTDTTLHAMSLKERQDKLFAGWRFKCECERCEAEALHQSVE